VFGTIVNAIVIVIASIFGVIIGSKLSNRLRESLMHALGLVVLVIGITMAIKTSNIVFLTVSILIGTAIGEIINIEFRLQRVGEKVERRFEGSKFAEGFVSSTLLFCVGSMAVIGPIQEGLTGDSSILLTKSMLDGVAAVALSSTLGIGVLFSSIPVLIYQGLFSMLAIYASNYMSEIVVNEISATGGILIMAIGLRLMEVIDLKPGNMLPSLLISPVFISIFH